MTREDSINMLKQVNYILVNDDDYWTENTYEPLNTAFSIAIKALEQEPMENFESTKDHILKLAGDYKCWDNRLTHDEALELCHMLEQEPCEDANPIVHAHWIEGRTDNPNIHNILCSHCFEGYPSKGHANSQYTKKKFQWCPSCGAKMEVEE